MSRWMRYLVIFLLGGLTALGLNRSFFSRYFSLSAPKQTVISEGVATASGGVSHSEEMAQVARVIDGDTVDLADGRRVRYIGIDAPETEHEKKPASCFGKEATEENKRMVEGKTVRLEKDTSEMDKYGRLLRYVYVGDVFINDYLVRQGFARPATFPPDISHQEQFLVSEREAREQKRGLWARCP